MSATPGYNERIFNKGFRARMHLARFLWLRKAAAACFPSSPLRVIELGCFDGRSIDWLPQKPLIYDGFDANWENGLDLGRARFAGVESIRFHQCSSPSEMIPDAGGYDIGICLETMEHVPPEMVAEYLDVFKRSVKTAVFFTVPNEIGVPFFGKTLAKKLLYRDSLDEAYTFSEFWHEALGQTSKVHRSEHKGFDYRRFIDQAAEKFTIQHIEGIPFSWLPVSLSFTVGIVAEPK